MKYPIRGWIRSVLAVAMCFVMVFCLVGCDLFERETQTPQTPTGDSGDDGGGEVLKPSEPVPLTDDDF